MSWILRKFKHREEKDHKEAIMMRNGAMILKDLIASSHGKHNPYFIFSAEELEIATNNYQTQKLIIKSYDYTLYKGFWRERSISVMKFASHILSINNIVYAAQMCHNHILKLIGCCLETPIPILVFEIFNYGTLADRIYGNPQPQFQQLLLPQRLRIAMDIANALAYLHLGFPWPIVFRNMKTSHILFNEENVAKLFDFSFSVSIPEGATHITDEVMGTLGYIAPEYVRTGVFNEKSDVFSFGAFLSELLTGRKISDLVKAARDLGYPFQEYLKKYFEGHRFTEIGDPIIVQDISCLEKEQRLQASAQLLFECLKESPVDRPTMVDVAKELRQIYRSFL